MCVSILARRCAIGKRKTRLPAIIESDLIKRRFWECIELHVLHHDIEVKLDQLLERKDKEY